MSTDRLVRRAERFMAALFVMLTAAAWAGWSPGMAGGVALGGAVAGAGYVVLKWQLGRAFGRPGRPPGKAGLVVGWCLRFGAFAAVLGLVLSSGVVNPVAFVAGLSVVMLGIVLAGVVEVVIMLRRGEM